VHKGGPTNDCITKLQDHVFAISAHQRACGFGWWTGEPMVHAANEAMHGDTRLQRSSAFFSLAMTNWQVDGRIRKGCADSGGGLEDQNKLPTGNC